MKTLTLLCASALLLVPLEARTWTSTDGRELEAEFVSATETHVKVKRDVDGKELTIPLTGISEEDREWVEEKLAEEPEPEEKQAVEGEYAGLITGEWELAEHGKLPYAFYGSKELDGGSKYPLVVSLHGKSDNNENGKQIGFARKFSQASNYKERPCLILAPLCYQPHGGTGGGWDDAPGEETLDLIKELLKELPIVDPDRVYVIGYSMGGFGTWHFLKEEPKMFAAGVPIAGYGHGVGKLRSMPIWSFHGAKDKVV
ncbi:MAG: prolyl oligopeptidase family serine peptidase, partial [Verrucomicrobiota bacterium]